MKTRLLTLIGSAALLLAGSTAVFAHHGAAAYDTGKPTTLKGTVTEFKFMNPHTEIFLDVADASGKTTNWLAELGGVTGLSRVGWTPHMLKPGDQITVTGNRSKNSSNSLRLQKVVLPNGKEFNFERGEDYTN